MTTSVTDVDPSTGRRVAVVTGGAQGIGHGITRRLIDDGHTVVIFDIDPDLDKAVSGLGAHCSGIHCDITDPEQVRTATAEVLEVHGQVHVLVNNAGWATKAAFLDLDPDSMRRILDVNLMGTLEVTRAFLPSLMESEAARIVMMSSDAARVGVPQESIYAAAKAGVVGFSKSLALELARTDTTVNVISPGPIETPLLRELLTAEQLESRMKTNPMRRFGTIDEVAAIAAYLVSRESAFVTGQVLSINGGLLRVD